MDYRNEARKYLKRSKEEFGTGDQERLKYAALELRMAMEALTYDRARAYKNEFPPDEYETWQPIKVMSILVDIDPTAGMAISLAVGREEVPGVPASEMTSMGSEKVLNMATLKKHYSALGSYLHVQSMKQALSGKPIDFGGMRSRCEEIIVFVEEILTSPVHNIIVGNFSTVGCMKCGETLRKRMRNGQCETHVECFDCGASYTLIDKENGQVEWKPQRHEVGCGNRSCGNKSLFWQKDMEISRWWICSECKGRNTFALGVRYEAEGSWNESR
jgi:hypothetical protein